MAFLRETCDQPAVLIGNSLGGRTALEAALELARRRARPGAAVPGRRVSQAAPARAVRPAGARRDRVAAGADATQDGDCAGCATCSPTRPGSRSLVRRGDRRVRARRRRSAPNRLAIFSALRHIYLDEPFGETGFWDRLPALQPPALFIWGDRDVLVPAGFGRFVAEALPSARRSCWTTAVTCRSSSTASEPPLSPATSSTACPPDVRRRGQSAATSSSAAVKGSVLPATTRAAASSSAAEPCTCGESLPHRADARSPRSRSRRGPGGGARQLTVRGQPAAVLVDRRDHVVDALGPGGDGLHDRRPPRAGHRVPSAERLHVPQVARHLVGAVAVGLVDHEDVGDLEDAGLRRLDAVAHPGREHAPAWCRPARRSRPRPARRRPSRPARRRSRRRRAPAAPAARPRTARRGARARPSTG